MNINICRVACTIALALFTTAAIAQSQALESARLTPEELKWAATPTGSLIANPAGDDKKAGMYIYRAKFPQNYKVQPHFHPDDRIVTVLSGTLLMGYGEQFDESNIKALPAGSIWTEPARAPHFVWARDGEVVIQVIGANGPSGTTPIQPK